MALNKHVKRKWLRALKSGEYAKGRGQLANLRGEPEYCCLGVLVCEMAPEFTSEAFGQLKVVGSAWDATNYIPDDLAIMWGLDRDTQYALGRGNDNANTFAPVIAYIESNL